MSLISGGAGWSSSPRPDLRGPRVGNCPGLPENTMTALGMPESRQVN